MSDFRYQGMQRGSQGGSVEDDKSVSFRSDLVIAQLATTAVAAGTAVVVGFLFKAYAKYPNVCLAQVLAGTIAAGLDLSLRSSAGECREKGHLKFSRRIAFYRRFPFYATCLGTALLLLAYGIFEVVPADLSESTRFYFGLGVLCVELVLTAWSSSVLLPIAWEFNRNRPLPDARAYAGQHTYSDVGLSSFAGGESPLLVSGGGGVTKGTGGGVGRDQADMIGFLQTKVGDLGEQLLVVVGQLQASEAEVKALKQAIGARGIRASITRTTAAASTVRDLLGLLCLASSGAASILPTCFLGSTKMPHVAANTTQTHTNASRFGQLQAGQSRQHADRGEEGQRARVDEEVRRNREQQERLIEENTRLLALLRQEKVSPFYDFPDFDPFSIFALTPRDSERSRSSSESLQ